MHISYLKYKFSKGLKICRRSGARLSKNKGLLQDYRHFGIQKLAFENIFKIPFLDGPCTRFLSN